MSTSIGIGMGMSLGGIGGGESASLNPASISGLVLWVKADSGTYSDAGTTPATNGQAVQQWNDLSVSAKHFSGSGAARPTLSTGLLNGLPGIVFDGVDDKMTNTLALTAASTVFIVAKAVSASGTTKRFITFGADDASVFDNSGAFAYYSNQAAGVVSIGGTVTNASVITLNYASASSCTPYLNGTAGSAFDPADTYTTANMILGTDINLDFKNCNIFEVVVYNTSLSSSDVTSINRYLGTRWGITVA